MIQTIAVLGAGTMGHGIAHTFSRHGYQVNLYEPFDAVRESAPQKIREELQFMVDEGYITEADRDNGIRNITMYASLEDTARDADYVIEACPEKMELKQKLFSQLDAVCKPTAVFATNTSSLKLSEMIAHLPPERQARCMVSHWYNPAYLIPIAELSKFGNMPEDVFQEVYDLYVACEKQPVRVLKDITGMVANRILHAQARECFYLAEIGAALPEDIDKALKYGPCFRNATTGMLEVADISKTSVCPLAKVMRYELKKRGISGVKAVYSKEIPIKPAFEAEDGAKRSVPGSISFVPPAAGLIIASEVIKDLIGGAEI